MWQYSWCAVLVWSTCGIALGVEVAPRVERPNVVIINCDDLGYGDLGAYGAVGYATPHADRLAAEGNRFTRFYVAQAVCSASRTALLTGCYPNRLGIQGALGPRARVGIHADETTLGELFQGRGYATAIFGKWHLGDTPKFLPTHHGFDEYFGLPYSNDMWPHHPEFSQDPAARQRKRGFPELPLIEGDRVVDPEVTSEDQRQLTRWYTERAVKFIEQHRETPFLLYVAHSMPHVPLHVGKSWEGRTARGLYGDVIAEIDASLGQILAALDRGQLAARTLVLFTSDNGPWLSYGEHAGSAGPLREGKGTSWEGGVRVPLIVRWPGVIPAGAVTQEPAMTLDLFPTFAHLIGAALPMRPIDGLDVWPLLSAEAGAKCPHEAYYFYYADNELQAVSSGAWKLYLPHRYRTLAGRPGGREGRPAAYEQRTLPKPELYDVMADEGEAHDVAAEHPEIVQRILAYAEQARADLGDSLTGRIGSGRREPGRLD